MNQEVDQNYNPKYMLRAVELSEMAYKSGKGLPIGCVITRNGEIIGEGHNEVFLRMNPTAHAEMVAIERACEKAESVQLSGCELYTSVEPCPMCLSAIYWAKIDKIYYVNTSSEVAEFGFDDSFIFDELRKNAEQRKIKSVQVSEPNARFVLERWKDSDDAAAYPWDEKGI
jgi:tRNA(Arg) A34 adenosine deaminase TadA